MFSPEGSSPQKGTVYSGTADNEQYPGFIQLRRVLGGLIRTERLIDLVSL